MEHSNWRFNDPIQANPRAGVAYMPRFRRSLLARIPILSFYFAGRGIENVAHYQATTGVQATDIGNAIVMPVDLATPIRPPRLDSTSSLISGTSAGHFPSVALIPSHRATTKPVTM